MVETLVYVVASVSAQEVEVAQYEFESQHHQPKDWFYKPQMSHQ